MTSEIDDDDWGELDWGVTPGGVQPEVTVVVTEPGQRKMDGAMWTARGRIYFRRGAAEWVNRHNRFRVEVGKKHPNRIRLTPDNLGRFEAGAVRGGVLRMSIGRVPAWPDDEGRRPTKATWEVRDGCMILTLPGDWAEPREQDS